MDIAQMYASENIEVGLLLRWCKLLEYDFFRLYSQHLILYSPPSKLIESFGNGKTSLPFFRKNIYTKEIIDFIIEQIDTGKKTKKQIVDEYKIPKTTLYKWINKYKVNGVSGL
jgi:DNA invertase Pin-like site-specific DNA recombinase